MSEGVCPRVDALAGGPVIYPDSVRERVVELCESEVPTYQVYRDFDEMITTRMVRGELSEYWKQIDRSGVDVLSVSVGAWGEPQFGYDPAVHDLEQWRRRFRHTPRLLLVKQPDEIHRAVRERRTGILLGFQNSDPLAGDLDNVEMFADRGVRMVQLTYNGRNDAGSGCTEPYDHGLTRYGRDLVRRLNDVGVIVDVSHCGPRTSMEAIEVSRAPVAVSHAACTALSRHDRNKTDDLIRLLGERGGFFGVCAVPFFLRHDGQSSVHDIVRHVTHVAEVAGSQSVGIGTDWGVPDTPSPLLARLQDSASRQGFRGEHRFQFAARTEGFVNWSDGWALLAEEINHALEPSLAAGVLGGNFADFFDHVWAAAP
jgi:membrane dipeptidase